jgi:hypothetical protein
LQKKDVPNFEMTVVANMFKKIISFALILMLVFSFPFANSSQDSLAANLVQKQTLNEKPQREKNFSLNGGDAAAFATIAATSAAAGSALGSVTVATVATTTVAPLFGLQILASIGLATTSMVTTVVALPAAGIVAASGLAVYSGYKVYDMLHDGEHAEPAKETKSDRNKLAQFTKNTHEILQVAKSAHGILQVAKSAHGILP